MTEGTATATATLALPVGGMTCAACASRIEKKLNKLPGTAASVNYTLERASISYDPITVGPDEIVSTIEALGYSASIPSNESTRHEVEPIRSNEVSLRRRLLVAAPLALFTVVFSMIESLQFAKWEWVVGAAATVVVLFGGWPFHRAALKNLRHFASSMDTLVSIGTLVATGWSWWSLRGPSSIETLHANMEHRSMGGHQIYFEAGAVVIAFLLLGRILEGRAKAQAGEALRALATFAVRDVDVIVADGSIQTRPLAALLPGQRFLVRPGARIATDGVVVDGASSVDRSIITGESVPVEVAIGGEVTGGTLNTVGALTVRATRVGADTQLAQITRLVEHAQTQKANVQSLADRVSAIFVPTVLILALATFALWSWHDGNTTRALRAAISVLIIACPCALGLATPTALLVGTTRGAQLGLLLSGPQAIEASEKIDTLIFDKTGTLTVGQMRVAHVAPQPHVSKTELLALAAEAEQYSEHPVAHAIVRAATAASDTPPTKDTPPTPSDFTAVPGLGVEVSIDGDPVRVGKPSWATPNLTPNLSPDLTNDHASTVIGVSRRGESLGLIAVADNVKTTARDAIANAHTRGLRTMLLTGDAEPIAKAVAREVGIAEADVESGTMPAEKLEFIRTKQQRGHRVAMIGDGVNDAAALAAADLGIAMAAGSEVARAAADITVVGQDVHGVLHALDLAKATMRTIRMNLFWAFAYNVAALPIAASGRLNPMIAGAAMSFSSVFVVLNSVRLRRFQREIAPRSISSN